MEKFGFKDLLIALKKKDITERDIKFAMLGSAIATICMVLGMKIMPSIIQ